MAVFPEDDHYRALIGDLVEHLSAEWRCRRWDTIPYLVTLSRLFPDASEVEEVRDLLLRHEDLSLRWAPISCGYAVLKVGGDESATFDAAESTWVTPKMPSPRVAAALLRLKRYPDLDPFVLLGPPGKVET